MPPFTRPNLGKKYITERPNEYDLVWIHIFPFVFWYYFEKLIHDEYIFPVTRNLIEEHHESLFLEICIKNSLLKSAFFVYIQDLQCIEMALSIK